jgi:hypothetical protein
MLEIMSVAMPSVPCPLSILCPLGSSLDRFSKYTPVKMVRKPQRREIVLTALVVLKPPNRINEAQSVAVVNVT